MTKISDSNLVFGKIISPLIGFLFLFAMNYAVIDSGSYETSSAPLIVLCVIDVAFFMLIKKIRSFIIEEVYDCGEYLLVKARGLEEKVLLSNIVKVSRLRVTGFEPLISIYLAKPGVIGKEFAFCPITKSSPFRPENDPILRDLKTRVANAKSTDVP